MESRTTIVFFSGVFILLILSPFLFQYSLFAHTDAETRLYPLWWWYGHALKSNHGILWNPDIFSGYPSFVSIVGGFLSPISLIFARFLNPLDAYHWIVFGAAWGATLMTIVFLRALKFSFSASLLGGIVYVASQWAWIHDVGIVQSWFLMPLLFWALMQVSEKKWLVPIAVGGTGIAFGWIAGNWQYIFQMLFAAGVFALFLSLHAFKNDDARVARRILISFLVMIFFGAVFSSVSWVPSALLLQESAVRGEALNHWDAVSSGLRVGDIWYLFMPLDSALLPLSRAQWYIGILPLLFLGAGLRLRSKEIQGFFSWFFVASILLSLNHSPLFWLLHHVPLVSFFRYAFRWMLWGGFAAGTLVAYGVTRFEKEPDDVALRRFARQFFLFLIAICIVVAAGFLVTLVLRWRVDSVEQMFFRAFDQWLYQSNAHFSQTYYHDYIARMFRDALQLFYGGNFRFLFSALSLGISAWWLWMFLRAKQSLVQWVQWATLITTISIGTVLVWYPERFDRALVEKSPSSILVLRENPDPKIFTFLAGEGRYEFLDVASRGARSTNDVFEYNSRTLYPDVNLLYGIRSAESYDPLMSRAMASLLSYVGSERAESKEKKFIATAASRDEKIRIFKERKSILDFIGANYVFSPYDLGNDVFERVGTQEVTPYRAPLFIYKNKNARPLFYFTSDRSLIDVHDITPESLQMILQKQPPYEQIGVMRKEHTNQEFRFETNRTTPSFLILSQNALPGWVAFVDENPTSIHTYGGVFLAVEVAAGAHHIVLRYDYYELWRVFWRQLL